MMSWFSQLQYMQKSKKLKVQGVWEQVNPTATLATPAVVCAVLPLHVTRKGTTNVGKLTETHGHSRRHATSAC